MILLSTVMIVLAMEMWGISPLTRLDAADADRLNPRLMKTARVILAVVAVIALIVVANEYLATFVAASLIGGVAWKVTSERLRRKKNEQRTAMVAQFLGLVTAELKSGAEPGAAIAQAAEEVADVDMATALTAAARTTRAGRSGAQALMRHVDTIPQLKPLASVWTVSEKYGISLTELVSNAQQRIDASVRHASAATASLQGARATAGILSLLPLLGVGMGYAMGVDTLAFLLGGGLGGVILVVGISFLCAGVAMSQKIIASAQ